MISTFRIATWTLIILIAGATSAVTAVGQGPSPAELRLQYRTVDQSLLYVTAQGRAEAEAAQSTCRELGLTFQAIDSLADLPLVVSQHHAILVGSNGIDFFGGDASDQRKDEVFRTLESFVTRGGHLLFFGSYNGRNSERLAAFGVHTEHFHNDYFRLVPGRSEVLFHGRQHQVPEEHEVHSYGNFHVDPQRRAIMMLQRGPATPIGERAEGDPDGSVLTTIEHHAGRFTYCPVEPYDSGLWLVPIVVQWMTNGAPTTKSQLAETSLVSAAELVKHRRSQVQRLTEAEQRTAAQTLDSQPLGPWAASDDPAQQVAGAFQTITADDLSRSPAERFVLRQRVWQQLADLGHLRTADGLVLDSFYQFEFDLLQARLDLLWRGSELEAEWMQPQRIGLLIDWATAASEQLDFQLAQGLIDAGQQLADDEPEATVQQLKNRLAQLQPLVDAQAAVTEELAREAAGSDLSASQRAQLGRFYALSVGIWDHGLALLADSDHPQLAACAAADLQQPTDARQRVELAKQWAALPASLTLLERRGAHTRARYWYQLAMPGLLGDEQVAVETAIGQLEIPRTPLHFRMKLDGAGRLEISNEQLRWVPRYGVPVETIELGDLVWRIDDQVTLPNQGVTAYLPSGSSMELPRLKKIQGRGMVVLRRTTDGLIIVDLNDVPVGADQYEFVVEVLH